MNGEGKRESPRMRWIVDRHVRPLFEATRELAARSAPTLAGDGEREAVFFYLLVGAATQIFHQAPECRRLTGRDPGGEAMLRAHTEALIALFASRPDHPERREA
jgi:hypothetical protein